MGQVKESTEPGPVPDDINLSALVELDGKTPDA